MNPYFYLTIGGIAWGDLPQGQLLNRTGVLPHEESPDPTHPTPGGGSPCLGGLLIQGVPMGTEGVFGQEFIQVIPEDRPTAPITPRIWTAGLSEAIAQALYPAAAPPGGTLESLLELGINIARHTRGVPLV